MDFRLNLIPAGMLAVALFAVPAIADTVTDDGAMTNGVYYGSGNSNTAITVDNNNGVQLGESAITRFVGPITPTPSNSNVYDVPLGDTTVAGKTGANWGIFFGVDLTGTGLSLHNITATWTLTDLATGTTGTFNPLLIPDNALLFLDGSTFNGNGAPPTGKGTPVGAENSEALSFASIAAAFGDPSFSDNINDTFYLTLTVDGVPACAVGCSRPQLASDEIVINQGAGFPLAVDEPSSIAILGLALLTAGCFGFLRIRRKDGFPA